MFRIRILNNFLFVQYIINIQWQNNDLNKWYISNAVVPGNMWQEMMLHSNWKFHTVWQNVNSPCVIYNVHQNYLNRRCCDHDCFTFIPIAWCILCSKDVFGLCSVQMACVYSFYPAEQLIAEDMISTVITSKYSTKCKLFSIQEKMNTEKAMDAN